MGWLTALTNLANAARAYYEYKRETEGDRRIVRARAELRRLAEEIDALRADGSPGDQQRADFLRSVYAVEARHVEYLLARRAAPEGRDAGGDS